MWRVGEISVKPGAVIIAPQTIEYILIDIKKFCITNKYNKIMKDYQPSFRWIDFAPTTRIGSVFDLKIGNSTQIGFTA